jgi:DNA polymerase V
MKEPARTFNLNRVSALMATMDHINRKYSKGTIKLAAEGIERVWRMRRSFKSPNYVGRWEDLPRVR